MCSFIGNHFGLFFPFCRWIYIYIYIYVMLSKVILLVHMKLKQQNDFCHFFLSFFPSYRQIDRLNMSQVDKSRFAASFPIKQQNDFCSFLPFCRWTYICDVVKRHSAGSYEIEAAKQLLSFLSFLPFYRCVSIYVKLAKVVLLIHMKRNSETTFVVFFPFCR